MEGAKATATGVEGPTVDAGPMVDTGVGDFMPGRRYSRTRPKNSDYYFTRTQVQEDPWRVLEQTLKSVVGYGNYDYRKSIIPMYDDIYRYLDNLQKARDYEKNTGKSPAYGSSGYTFGNVANLVSSGARTVRNAVYAVGNLSKRF